MCECIEPSSVSDSIDSVTWLVLLRESVDCDRYLRPLIGISSNTGLVRKKKRSQMAFIQNGESIENKMLISRSKITQTHKLAAAHPAMLLMERLFERLLPWKAIMVVGLRDDGRVAEECSSGDRMADQGRSLVPPPETQEKRTSQGHYSDRNISLFSFCQTTPRLG